MPPWMATPSLDGSWERRAPCLLTAGMVGPWLPSPVDAPHSRRRIDGEDAGEDEVGVRVRVVMPFTHSSAAIERRDGAPR